jgi:hypothetical protein
MHGFYYEGRGLRARLGHGALLGRPPDGSEAPYPSTDLGDGKYDVVLAGGKGFSGKAYYNLSYGGDFAAGGLIGLTTSAKGEKLVYFDWGPVAWDESLEYRACGSSCPSRSASEKLGEPRKPRSRSRPRRTSTPRTRSTGTALRERTAATTSPASSTRRTCKPRGAAAPGSTFPGLSRPLRRALRGRGKTAASDEAEHAEERWPRSPRPPSRSCLERGQPPEEKPRDYFAENLRAKPLLDLAIFLPLIALALFLYTRRLASFRAKKALLAGISWAGDAWSPPRILVGSYQVPGKVAEGLHPLEVALLMELALPRVAAIMVEGLRGRASSSSSREPACRSES